MSASALKPHPSVVAAAISRAYSSTAEGSASSAISSANDSQSPAGVSVSGYHSAIFCANERRHGLYFFA
eukprot:CAMPEP_0177773692 /NCGR_PEP_ID=MMETSP0491_2-20121128/13020_1 /TAXON_ID=63592 /ORGANISM="Tetraselmis chuii, Strain PLY429" /LENGTH=68 /DNA_ID=CAMNT_0019291843 /DNA_START=252 /DNA_END=455 /DNA_ORIENTATION=+